ncbi:putative prolyl 4-hydroxylase 7 [Cucurbita argyrosperma subsp. argyrosperma]|nr:putative prolyl 4-hydroxylase 7 [Cucurbita argyrosperma subsp. argyrosperma]
MDSRFFLAFSLCFLCSFPLFARPANRLPKLLLDDTKTEDSVIRMKMDGSSIKIDPTRVVQLSSQPRSDDIVAGIEAKIAAWTFLPVDNGEPIQILRYENGQQYVPHFDFFQDPVNVAAGGHRIATVLMYLSNVERGGETVFPDSPVLLSPNANCSLKPKKGDALLFFSLHPNVTTDPTSYHGSCPVIEGEKWSATKWIHMLPVDEIWRNPDCVDENEHCSVWAKAGECEKNPGYMVGSSLGSKEELGYCRLSCKACSPPS